MAFNNIQTVIFLSSKKNYNNQNNIEVMKEKPLKILFYCLIIFVIYLKKEAYIFLLALESFAIYLHDNSRKTCLTFVQPGGSGQRSYVICVKYIQYYSMIKTFFTVLWLKPRDNTRTNINYIIHMAAYDKSTEND